MTRHSRKQPTKLDINDSLAQLSVKKPDAADKCRADLLELIHRTSRILCRFEKHLDTSHRPDSRKNIKAHLLSHAIDLLSFESTVNLRISREIAKHRVRTIRVPCAGTPGYKTVPVSQLPTAKSKNSLKPGPKIVKRSTQEPKRTPDQPPRVN